MFGFGSESTVTFSGGRSDDTDFGIFGWPTRDLDDIKKGKYQIQAFLTKYENVTRSDGSMISVHFPCNDGGRMPDGNGSLATPAQHIEITGKSQQINLKIECGHYNVVNTSDHMTILTIIVGTEMINGAN